MQKVPFILVEPVISGAFLKEPYVFDIRTGIFRKRFHGITSNLKNKFILDVDNHHSKREPCASKFDHSVTAVATHDSSAVCVFFIVRHNLCPLPLFASVLQLTIVVGRASGHGSIVSPPRKRGRLMEKDPWRSQRSCHGAAELP